MSVDTAETNAIAVVAYVASDTSFSLCGSRTSDAPSATATFRSLAAVRSFSSISGSDAPPGEATNLTATSLTPIWILDVAGADPAGMAIVAHALPIGTGIANQLYEFSIHRGSCAGAQLGATGYRPGVGAVVGDDFDTLLLSAFDPSPAGVASYALCGRKSSGAAPDLGIYLVEIAALPLPAPEPAAAAASTAALAALARRRHRAPSV